MNRKIQVFISLTALGALAAVGIWRSLTRLNEGAGAGKPDILLVTFDTTRADHIGAYGWPTARTPALDGLARDGVVFTAAFSPAPLTLPSHASIMTGLYPFYHGVRENAGQRVSDAARTLAERLGDAGYQTAAAIAAFVLDSRVGLDQGFADYRDAMPDASAFESFEYAERSAERVADDALDWLEGRDEERPIFLWCHFFDPHTPYLPPVDFTGRRVDPYDGEIAFADLHLERLIDRLDESRPDARPTLVVVTADHGESLGEHGEPTHEYFAYDSTLHVPLIIRLPDKSRAGSRIDVPVSLVDVLPTILDLAGLPVPNKDEIHGRSLAGVIRGRPDAGSDLENRPIYFESYSPMHNYGWAPLRGIRIGETKYIEAPVPELYLLGEDRLEGPQFNRYGQQPELASNMAEALREMVEAPLKAPALSGAAGPEGAESMGKLRSLGYLAGPASSEHSWTVEDDPKTRLPLFISIVTAMSQVRMGDVAGGVGTFVEILRTDPNNPRCLMYLASIVARDPRQAQEGLAVIEGAAADPGVEASVRASLLADCGRAYLELEDPQKALAYFRQGIELNPRDAEVNKLIATTCVRLGRPVDAIEPALLAAEMAPSDDPWQIRLGLIRFCNEQFEEGAGRWLELLTRSEEPMSIWGIAEECTSAAALVETCSDNMSRAAEDAGVPALVRAALRATLGRCALDAGQAESAHESLRLAASIAEQDDADGLRLQAQALTALGRAVEGRQLLKRAYAHDPDDVRVVVDLFGLLYANGETSAAVRLLSDYYDSHPEDPTAANNLAWILADSSTADADLERALALARFAVARRPSNSGFGDTLGFVYLRRNEAEPALNVLSQVVERSPDVPEYQYHLGQAYRMSGQIEPARDAFRKAIELAPTPRPDWYEDAVAGSKIAD